MGPLSVEFFLRKLHHTLFAVRIFILFALLAFIRRARHDCMMMDVRYGGTKVKFLRLMLCDEKWMSEALLFDPRLRTSISASAFHSWSGLPK